MQYKKYKIKLNTVDKVFEFSKKITSFDEDIDIETLDFPSNTLDAKSLIGLFSLDLSRELVIGIHTSNDNSAEKFKALVEQYK